MTAPDPSSTKYGENTVLMAELKVCLDCGEAKPFSAFYNDRRRKDGKNVYCGSCKTSQSGEYERNLGDEKRAQRNEKRRIARRKREAKERTLPRPLSEYAGWIDERAALEVARLMLRRCFTCKTSQPLAIMQVKYVNGEMKTSICKPCNAWRQKQYQVKYPEKYKAAMARSAAKARENPQKRRDQHRKKVYGLSPADYAAMLNHQQGVCAICSRPPREGKALCVDHDHGTGVVRGLLCDPCNGGMGLLQDSEEIMALAITYLQKSRLLK